MSTGVVDESDLFSRPDLEAQALGPDTRPGWWFLGTKTNGFNAIGIWGTLNVVDPQVQLRPSQQNFLYQRLLTGSCDGSQWMSIGWGELESTGDDNQYIITYTRSRSSFMYFPDYPISPGERVQVGLIHAGNGLWEAQIFWDGSWHVIDSMQDTTGNLGCYSEDFVEVRSIEGGGAANFGFPPIEVGNGGGLDGMKLAPADGGPWRTWDATIPTITNTEAAEGTYTANWVTPYYSGLVTCTTNESGACSTQDPDPNLNNRHHMISNTGERLTGQETDAVRPIIEEPEEPGGGYVNDAPGTGNTVTGQTGVGGVDDSNDDGSGSDPTAPNPTAGRVIGTDNRIRVQDTDEFPYTAIVHITSNLHGTCSGFMLSKDTVVTAGHCVYDNGGWATISSLRVRPGRENFFNPFGACRAEQDGLWAPEGWVINGDRDWDFAAIVLRCNVGRRTGRFGMRATKKSLNGVPVSQIAYHGDKDNGRVQYRTLSDITHSGKGRLFYENDSTGGSSGSPIYHSYKSCRFCVVAIHAASSCGASNDNCGPRIRRTVMNQLYTIANRRLPT